MHGSRSVLDLGCGAHSPLMICDIEEATGVDFSDAAITDSKRLGIHQSYVVEDIRATQGQSGAFDAVAMLSVLHLLDKDAAEALLTRAETWARKRVIVRVPNVLAGVEPIEDGADSSAWSVADLARKGYTVRGLGGSYALQRCEIFKMRLPSVWLVLQILSQAVTYRFPRGATELFAVKTFKED